MGQVKKTKSVISLSNYPKVQADEMRRKRSEAAKDRAYDRKFQKQKEQRLLQEESERRANINL